MSDTYTRVSILLSDNLREATNKIFKCMRNENLSIGSADLSIIGGSVTAKHSKGSPEIAIVTRTSFFSSEQGKIHEKPGKKFITGSSYIGEWNALGFYGEGTYRFPHGVIYKGEFNKEGEFHGIGTLLFPGGEKIRGMWKNGHLLDDATYIYRGGAVMQERYKYCQMPDRRFFIEMDDEMNPAGQEYLSDSPFPRQLPPGTYDMADGVSEPATDRIMVDVSRPTLHLGVNTPEISLQGLHKTHVTSDYSLLSKDSYYYRNRSSISYEFEGQMCREIPNWPKRDWIREHCRKAEDEPVGYRPDFYEMWMAGRRREVYNCFLEDSSIVDDLLIPEKVLEKNAGKPSPFYSFIRKSSYKKWISEIAGKRKTIDIKAPATR